MKITNRKQPRRVETGAGWYIEYSPADKDFGAYIEGAGLLGYRGTKDEARELIHDCMCDAQAVAAAQGRTA